MAECPVCFGDGQHDMTDIDAMIGEHWTDRQIASAVKQGMVHPVGIVACDECEGTGVVSYDRRRDLLAVAAAVVDQVLARLYAEERQPKEGTT